MCYYLGKLQEEHYLLSKPPKRKGEVDIMIKVPMLGYACLAFVGFQHWKLSQQLAVWFFCLFAHVALCGCSHTASNLPN